MKSSAKNVKLALVDDLFTTEESRADDSREKVVEIPLSELHPFKNHPFKVKDDEAMMDTAAIMPARLPGKIPCRSLSVIWAMMPRRLSWLTATCSVKNCSPVSEPLPTR